MRRPPPPRAPAWRSSWRWAPARARVEGRSMNRFARIGFAVLALSLGVLLAGCEGFDPTSFMDSDFFNTKKRLPGERKPVFPEGTPGVTQGVPKELVKGYESAGPAQDSKAQESQPTAPTPEAKAEAKPKPKPKPKVVAKPKDESGPTAITIRPSQEQAQSQAQSQPQAQPQSQAQWPDPPPMRQQPAAGGVAWPDPPATR